MSHFLDRLTFFKKTVSEFSNGHGAVSNEDRSWENAYRSRWQQDKIVRSTHGVNCTGSCSWRIYVKNGLITWEIQQTDYPRTRADLPNHEPRGCPRGASYSWYVYSAQRVKYPLIRGRLMDMWREVRKTLDPVEAWRSITQDPVKAKRYKSIRGQGGFVRAKWDEGDGNDRRRQRHHHQGLRSRPHLRLLADSRDVDGELRGRVALHVADRRRVRLVLRLVLRPAAVQPAGVGRADRRAGIGRLVQLDLPDGCGAPMCRRPARPTPHFYTEVRYKGTKTVAVSSDFGEMVKFGDIWLAPKQGTDAALALAMGHVILTEFHNKNRSEYFDSYCRQYNDHPMLVMLKEHEGKLIADRYLRASDLTGNMGQDNNPEWKTVVYDENTGYLVAPNGSIGFRWGQSGAWNLEMRDGYSGKDVKPQLTLLGNHDEIVEVALALLRWRP